MTAKYRQFVMNLVKSGEAIIETITPEKAHLLHMAVGISGEAGELLDAVKKTCIYNKELDLENVIEELGDIEFYMEGLRSSLGLTRDDILLINMEKLNKRYSKNTYSDEQAQQRVDKA
ncbi:MAG: nucleoside triphosphate pyrophosphohydrolase family protein [Ignisphaera sp.]|nr:nucleoside triphosphate pyrophosphohydrolase family protein [Ignisphaera sp.]